MPVSAPDQLENQASSSSATRLLFFEHLSKQQISGNLVEGSDKWLAPVVSYDAQDGFDEEVWLDASPDSHLAYRISGSTVKHRSGRESSKHGPFALTPKGEPNYFTGGPVCFAHVYLADAFLDRGSDLYNVPALSGRLRPDLIFKPEITIAPLLASYVERAVARRDRAGTLEMEGRALLLLDGLLRVHGSPARASCKGGLATWQERRLEEYITDNIDRSVSLDELSQLVQLSAFHFARAFKLSTGLPPHAFQRRLRVRRACELLAYSRFSIGEIAAAVGYETPQAFARMFRAQMGISASEYRRRRRF